MNQPSALPTQAHIGFGMVRHKRLRPAVHQFEYPTCFLYLPMRSGFDERVIARNRFAPLSFFDADHGRGESSALPWLDALLADAGVHDAVGEAWLHAYPRIWGHTFKPVSFWYCHNLANELRAVVAEVNNTFGERHCYVLANADGRPLRNGHTLQAHKRFHVSPFCDVDGGYTFAFVQSGSRTLARVDHHNEGGPLLETSVSGELIGATPAVVRQALWAHPLLTLGVIARIHWHALRLWAKRVPFFSKPHPPKAAATYGHATPLP